MFGFPLPKTIFLLFNNAESYAFVAKCYPFEEKTERLEAKSEPNNFPFSAAEQGTFYFSALVRGEARLADETFLPAKHCSAQAAEKLSVPFWLSYGPYCTAPITQ